MIKTDEQKRDFIAEEIRKRIIGPGYSQETYACDDDASDEVIDFRPNVIYTAGILFPKRELSVSSVQELLCRRQFPFRRFLLPHGRFQRSGIPSAG